MSPIEQVLRFHAKIMHNLRHAVCNFAFCTFASLFEGHIDIDSGTPPNSLPFRTFPWEALSQNVFF